LLAVLVNQAVDAYVVASMGASEGKAVGEWFGPNTVAQVLRCAYISIEFLTYVTLKRVFVYAFHPSS